MDRSREILLYATSECSRKCNHCYLGYNGSWEPDELFRCAEHLQRDYVVIINGAEVLSNVEYLRSFKLIGQQFIFTNGVYLASNRFDYYMNALLDNDVKSVRISHHFDSIDCLNAVKATVVERAINRLLSFGFEVRINTTITSESFDKIARICESAVRLGVKHIRFFCLQNIGSAKGMNRNLFLSDDMKLEMYGEVLRCRSAYGIEDLYIGLAGNFSKIVPHFTCSYGTNMLSITPDKKIYGCPFAVGNLPPIGILTDHFDVKIDSSLAPSSSSSCLIEQW